MEELKKLSLDASLEIKWEESRNQWKNQWKKWRNRMPILNEWLKTLPNRVQQMDGSYFQWLMTFTKLKVESQEKFPYLPFTSKHDSQSKFPHIPFTCQHESQSNSSRITRCRFLSPDLNDSFLIGFSMVASSFIMIFLRLLFVCCMIALTGPGFAQALDHPNDHVAVLTKFETLQVPEECSEVFRQGYADGYEVGLQSGDLSNIIKPPVIPPGMHSNDQCFNWYILGNKKGNKAGYEKARNSIFE